MSSAKSFAIHGSEKMIYDARMQPQAVASADQVLIVYQANATGLPGHPHLIRYDRAARRWSDPIQLGEAAGLDHHFAPILWRDRHELWHVLYNCHFSPGMHLISATPMDAASWRPAPPIAPSISYPSVWTLAGDRRLMLYRVHGHLGYWVYRLSDDGGATWAAEQLLLDFDFQPTDEIDRWAGSYPSITIDRAGGAHIGLCYWDERDGCHPRYTFKRDLLTRYNLYYLHLDSVTGRITSVDGNVFTAPVNRRAAERCKVRDTGSELTNFPIIGVDRQNQPMLIAPITHDDPWRCRFHFFRRSGGEWVESTIVDTDNTWNAARFVSIDDSEIVVDLIVGEGKGGETFYGGGELQRWRSSDGGQAWRMERSFVPQEGLLYNNPSPVHRVCGGLVDDAFVFYGWQGPGGVWALPEYDTENRNRGMVWLWIDGGWA